MPTWKFSIFSIFITLSHWAHVMVVHCRINPIKCYKVRCARVPRHSGNFSHKQLEISPQILISDALAGKLSTSVYLIRQKPHEYEYLLLFSLSGCQCFVISPQLSIPLTFVWVLMSVTLMNIVGTDIVAIALSFSQLTIRVSVFDVISSRQHVAK